MAAGLGRRLRPLTERWPKPVLPIDGRAVVATLMGEIAAAGLERVTIVVGHLAEQVEALVGDGTAFGVRVRYARQPEALGSADAVRRALAAGARPPFVVAGADTVFARGDVGAFAARFAAGGAAAALAVRREPPPGAGRSPVRVESGRVVRVPDADGAGTLSGAPLWGLTAGVSPFLENLPGPPHELADAAQRAIDAGHVMEAVEIGPTRDLTYPVDLVLENFPYLLTRR